MNNISTRLLNHECVRILSTSNNTFIHDLQTISHLQSPGELRQTLIHK